MIRALYFCARWTLATALLNISAGLPGSPVGLHRRDGQA
jgi:hypothetical protein